MPDQDGVYELDDAALLVRAIYSYERSLWDSARTGVPCRYCVPKEYDGRPAQKIDGQTPKRCGLRGRVKSVWVSMVDVFDKYSIEAHPFIAYSFDQAHIEEYCTEPALMLTDDALERWRIGEHKIAEKLKTQLIVQKRVAETEYACKHSMGDKTLDAWAGTIVKGSLALSPLMRYCLSMRLGGERFTRLASWYEAQAIMQFKRYREYSLKVWGALLPKGFVSRADEVYPSLLVVYNG